MDKKMRKVTKKIRKVESILHKAEHQNVALANFDEKVRDPQIKKLHQLQKKGKSHERTKTSPKAK